VAADPTIQGHPAFLLEHEMAPPTLITACADCGQLRTILFLARDRWYCTKCRAEGAAPPNLYPLA
jgi:hypothetical protein